MTKELSKAKGLFLATAVTVVMLIVMSLIGEFAVRYRERNREVNPDAQPMMYYRTNYLPHALVRDYSYFGWVNVNSLGFRGEETTVEKPDGVFRVMAVGASTTFDTSVSPDEDAWPERLEYWLGQQMPGRSFEVINAGVSGYTVRDNTVRLQNDLHRYDPDLIVLFHSHNDLAAALGTPLPPDDAQRPNEIQPQTPWGHWLEKRSLFYNKLKLRFVVLRRGAMRSAALSRADEVQWDERIARGTEKFERELRMFAASAEVLGIPVVMPSVVNVSGDRVPTAEQAEEVAAWARTNGSPPEIILRGYASFKDATRRAAEAQGATFIDTSPFGLVGWEWFSPGDPAHFSSAGADRMGQNLAAALIEAGVVTSEAEPGPG